MFKAMDKVDYDKLKLNSAANKPKSKARRVKPLLDLACVTISSFTTLLEEGIRVLPSHLAPKLLHSAIINIQTDAVSAIIANWPLDTLRFTDVLSEDEKDVFEEEMGCDYCVFRGVTARTKYCKLKCLDFRGLKLNGTFCSMIVQMWPLLSLKKHHLQPKKLAKVIAKTAGVSSARLTEDILPKIIIDRLNNDLVRSSFSRISLSRGQKMEVKIDILYFTSSSTFFMDYLVANCLRNITPIFITVTNIHIKSDLSDGEDITDSLAPFIVLKGHDTETLQGLSLQQLEEGILFMIAADIKKFRRLQRLDVQDCNIYLQEGVTRSRTVARSALSSLFGSFDHLRRLDISFNYLLGCLGELLDALRQPLEFLSVRSCDLNETDLRNLAESKHAPHLRELNLSKLCQFSIFENDRISPSYLLKILRHFPKVAVLNISQNHLPDSAMQDFNETLSSYLVNLKGLDIAGNILTIENQLDIARACAKIPSAQWLRLTCVNNAFLNGAMLPMQDNHLEEMSLKLREVLESVGRGDIMVNVVRLSYAILVDLIDIFD